MFAVFGVMRQLHELLWYLTEALALEAARPLHAQLGRRRHGCAAGRRLAAPLCVRGHGTEGSRSN
jgi:hypothetical protein